MVKLCATTSSDCSHILNSIKQKSMLKDKTPKSAKECTFCNWTPSFKGKKVGYRLFLLV